MTDEHPELRRDLLAAAGRRGLAFGVKAFAAGGLRLEPQAVVHTSGEEGRAYLLRVRAG